MSRRRKPAVPEIEVAGRQVAENLGTWVLHVARTHPRLADLLGWARMQAAFARGGEPRRAKVWAQFAAWLEQLDPQTYPQQIAAVVEGAEEAPWRGPYSTTPTVARDVAAQRNARPLPC